MGRSCSLMAPSRRVAFWGELQVTNRITPAGGRSCGSPTRVSNSHYGPKYKSGKDLGLAWECGGGGRHDFEDAATGKARSKLPHFKIRVAPRLIRCYSITSKSTVRSGA